MQELGASAEKMANLADTVVQALAVARSVGLAMGECGSNESLDAFLLQCSTSIAKYHMQFEDVVKAHHESAAKVVSEVLQSETCKAFQAALAEGGSAEKISGKSGHVLSFTGKDFCGRRISLLFQGHSLLFQGQSKIIVRVCCEVCAAVCRC
jgi:hypothetical protein